LFANADGGGGAVGTYSTAAATGSSTAAGGTASRAASDAGSALMRPVAAGGVRPTAASGRSGEFNSGKSAVLPLSSRDLSKSKARTANTAPAPTERGVLLPKRLHELRDPSNVRVGIRDDELVDLG
jgi:hypothetical protein